MNISPVQDISFSAGGPGVTRRRALGLLGLGLGGLVISPVLTSPASDTPVSVKPTLPSRRQIAIGKLEARFVRLKEGQQRVRERLQEAMKTDPSFAREYTRHCFADFMRHSANKLEQLFRVSRVLKRVCSDPERLTKLPPREITRFKARLDELRIEESDLTDNFLLDAAGSPGSERAKRSGHAFLENSREIELIERILQKYA